MQTLKAEVAVQFQNYIEHYVESAKTAETELYFHVDVVADAYSQGFADGKNIGTKEFIGSIITKHNDHLFHRATIIYSLSKLIIEDFVKKSCQPCSLFINVDDKLPSVFIAIPEKFMLDDDFITFAYSKIAEIRKLYKGTFNQMLDIALMIGENLDKELLKADGYSYQEDYCG